MPDRTANPSSTTLTSLSDEALIELMNQRSSSAERAFETLYLRHRDFVIRVAMRYCQDENDALDCVQETFAYLLRKFPGFVLTCRLTTFLFPVVKHQAIAKQRIKRKAISASALSSPENDEADMLDARPAPASNALTDTRLSDLHRVVEGLSPVHREVVIMRFVDDLSLEEIALALQVPVGTIKSRLHNALHALRADPRIRSFFRDQADFPDDDHATHQNPTAVHPSQNGRSPSAVRPPPA